MQKKISVHLGGTDFRCTVTDGRHHWTLDEPLEAGGGDTAHDPYGALLASLGSCSAITLRMYAKRKGWNIPEVTVHLSLEERHTAEGKVAVFYRALEVKGDLQPEQMARLEQIVKACPVSRILEGKIRIETKLEKV